MALTTSKSKASVNIYGGGEIKVTQVDENGTQLSSPDTPHSLGYIKESTLSDKTPTQDIIDETGNVVVTVEGNRSVMVTGTMLQSASGNINIAKEVRGKFYQMYKFNGTVNGKYQEIFFGTGSITPQIELKFADGTIPFEYKSSILESAVSIAASAYGAYCAVGSASGTTVSVAAGDYYTVVETAIS